MLLQFAEYLRKGEKDEKNHERMCLDFSNKWWSLLHTTRPFVITSLSQLAEVVSILISRSCTLSLAMHNLSYSNSTCESFQSVERRMRST